MKPVDYDILRYANCWEDADLLLSGLCLSPGKRILSIASAGDNSLALLASRPAEVHAIDISLPQLYLTELKQLAFAKLDHTEVLQLLGVDAAVHNSLAIYEHLQPKLSAGAKRFWTNNRKQIGEGLVYAGKFERYFKKFRTYFLPLVHGKVDINRLLAPKTQQEQIVFYRESWNNRRWKMLMSLFFNRYVLGKYGRAPQFLAHVNLSVADYIKQRTEQELSASDCAENYFLHMIFTGNYGPNLPYYLRAENFDLIKSNIHKLTIKQSTAEEAVKHGTFDAYNFSNIFEYMSEDAFGRLAEEWREYIPEGGRLAFWNLMNPRSFADKLPGDFGNAANSALSKKDKGFFYQAFLTEERL